MGRWAIILAALGAVASCTQAGTWQEVRWPFPRDAWPAGRAFACRTAACGGELTVFVRPKRGMCANCATGVTDDAEVDAVADLDLLSADFVPEAGGEPVVAGTMAGRMRRYRLRATDGTLTPAAGYLLSRPRQCDLLAVAAEGRDAHSPAAQAAVAAFLQSGPAVAWINRQMDGR